MELTSRKQIIELEQLRPLASKAAINVEKIHTLEIQLSLMENLRKRSTEMEIEIAMLRKEKLAWETFLESSEENNRPEDISRELNRERMAHKQFEERIKLQDSEIHELRSRIRTVEPIADDLEAKLREKHEQMEKLERRYERVDRQRNLAQREVQFLKEQLKTYDSEETVFFNGAGVDVQKQARIQSLEKLVEDYKSELEQVNKEGLILATNDTGKRKRQESEQDEELRRKIRILQNGIIHYERDLS